MARNRNLKPPQERCVNSKNQQDISKFKVKSYKDTWEPQTLELGPRKLLNAKSNNSKKILGFDLPETQILVFTGWLKWLSQLSLITHDFLMSWLLCKVQPSLYLFPFLSHYNASKFLREKSNWPISSFYSSCTVTTMFRAQTFFIIMKR